MNKEKYLGHEYVPDICYLPEICFLLFVICYLPEIQIKLGILYFLLMYLLLLSPVTRKHRHKLTDFPHALTWCSQLRHLWPREQSCAFS